MSTYISYPTSRAYKPLTAAVAELEIRQHPEYAVVTPENKEKMRRPVDPPPIVQLHVAHAQDPTREYLVNPFLFMTATLVEPDQQENGSYKPIQGVQIIGQNVSSLHRLRDINNKDGGFFVFGDISCRKLGNYRMQFNLFDFDKNNSQVAFVRSIVSSPFRVVGQKEFKGLSESTHLSRAFSDQGVRLRLRKEPRTISGAKRGYDHSPPDATPNVHSGLYGGPVHDRTHGQNYGYETPIQKRARSGSDHTNYGSASSQYSGHAVSSQYGISGAGSVWSSQSNQPVQPDHSPYGSLAPHLQPQMGPNPSYQRYVQPDAYAVDTGSAGGQLLSNGSRYYPSMTRNQQVSSYMQQPGQSYESRTSRDAYQSMPALQATASLPNSTLASHQSNDYQGHITQTGGQVANLNAGMFPDQQVQQDQAVQRHPAHYGVQTLPIHSSNQTYQTNAPSDSVYGQPVQPDVKYNHGNYQTSNNAMYTDSPPTGGLSDTSLPLDNGMLTRSFAPSQTSLHQSDYDGANGQAIDGFKQEPPPYPTPNQTSPRG